MPPAEALRVNDDESDFYGKHYFDKIAALHGLPPLSVRARADLPERCIHWLTGLLRYRLPPARILELGSSHGGFVAMMRWAGFDATGLDLSPEIVAEARRRFDVPILEGPVESQEIAPENLDAVVLMDVLEHLGDPVGTLRHCLGLLKPDGLFFLQTPQYREGKSLAQMEEEGDPFLQMLKPDQHLYLFSKSSVRQFFRVLGVEHVNFEPAIFSAYDMALIAGKVAPIELSATDAAASLEGCPSGRLVLALHDLNHRFEDLTSRHAESEADRAARLQNVLTMEKLMAGRDLALQDLNQRFEDLTSRYAASEADRSARLETIFAMEKLLAGRDARIEAQAFENRELTLRLESAQQTYAAEMATLTGINQSLRKEAADQKRVIADQERTVGLQNERLANAENLLDRIHQSHVFRLMRRFHLWGWLDSRGEDRSALTASPPSQTHRALRKVVVDLTPVLPGGGNGGAKVMTLELIRQFARIAVDVDFTLLTSEQSHDELATLDAPNVRRLCVNRPGAALAASDNLALRARSVLARFLGPELLAKVAGTYRKASGSLPAGNSLVRRLGADLLFCPFTAPFFFDSSVPTVCVVYDLQHAYYPQFFDAAELQERDRNLGKAVRLASGLISISEYVRKTLLEKTAVAADRVETIHIMLPRRLARPSISESERILQALQLTAEQFLLYPANFWPHKNHELLLTAFAAYLAGHPGSKLKLVLTGSPGARQDFLQDAARRMGISHAVLFPGYLPEVELSSLLHCCLALIFPSLFEGFGMPLLEGMAAGRPLLCSNSTSLPEVAGGAALLFDPRIPAEVAGAIARIVSDADLRRDLAAKGAQRLAAFGGPEEMAASYLRTFRKAVQEPAELPAGTYGVFEDGWVGEQFTIAFGSGRGSRTIRMALTLPEWVSTPALSIRVEAPGEAPRACTLVRGELTVIESRVGPGPGSVDVSCSPSFQPNLCGLGQDTRSLTCLLQMAEIVAADGIRGTLHSVGYGS